MKALLAVIVLMPQTGYWATNSMNTNRWDDDRDVALDALADIWLGLFQDDYQAVDNDFIKKLKRAPKGRKSSMPTAAPPRFPKEGGRGRPSYGVSLRGWGQSPLPPTTDESSMSVFFALRLGGIMKSFMLLLLLLLSTPSAARR
jgi:hypothetical protein